MVRKRRVRLINYRKKSKKKRSGKQRSRRRWLK
jgi:hypothetical protein